MTSSVEVKMMCNVWTTEVTEYFLQVIKGKTIMIFLDSKQRNPGKARTDFTSNGNTCKLKMYYVNFRNIFYFAKKKNATETQLLSDLRALLEKLRWGQKKWFALESRRIQGQWNAVFNEALLQSSGGGNPRTLPGW